MGRNCRRSACAMATALMMSMALSGCTIPFVNIDVPFGIPDINLPTVDLSELDLPKITLPIGVTTSVEDARHAALGGVSNIEQEMLVTPGYLTVGLKTATSVAPLCAAGEGGLVQGLDVDLSAALASELGLKVRYVPVVDESTLGTECDIVMNGESDAPDRVAIAGTYAESATSFFHMGDNQVAAITELGGKSVGLQGGSVSETVLNRTGLKMSQKAYPNLSEAFNALAAGEVDYVLCETYPGAYLATLHEGISFAGSLEAPQTMGIAVAASNAALVSEIQSAYDAILSNGTLDVARSRWVGALPTLTTESQIKDVPAGDSNASSTSPGMGGDGANDGSDAGSIAITNVS